jgi:hypothetical protein
MILPGVLTAVLFGWVTGHATMAIVSVAAAVMSGLVWWVDAKRRDRRRRRQEQHRVDEHRELVDQYVARWQVFEHELAERRRYEFVLTHRLVALVADGDERMWHRRPHRHDDAWLVSVGRTNRSVPVPHTDRSVDVADDPHLVGVRPGTMVGVHGARASDVMRNIVVQLAVRIGPADWCLRARPGSIERVAGVGRLPHARASAPHTLLLVDHLHVNDPDERTCIVVLAPERSALPAHCDVIIDANDERFDGFDVALTEALSRTFERWIDPCAALVIESADRPAVRSPLAACVGRDDIGDEVWIDIVDDGPHAVVVGTTGSGKSEMLVRWLTELMARNDPSELQVVTIDYKGGAFADRLAAWPHVVGAMTDLDASEVRRVLAALRQETVVRERLLREHHVASLDDVRCGSIAPRLIVVVDEVAALRARAPEFVEQLIDIAQRGRSLGMHLVMATQRPRALGADIVANSDIRVALRVQNAHDAVDIVGSSEAAGFDRRTPGRATLALSGTSARTFTVACAIAAPPLDPIRPEPLWRSALPRRLEPSTHTLAVIDDVERRVHHRLATVDGWWLVLGEPDDRSAVVRSIVEKVDPIVLCARECDAELVHRAVLALEGGRESRLVIDGIDDIVTHRLVDAAARSAWARLERCLAEGSVAVVVATATRESGVPTVVRDRCSRAFRVIDRTGGFETRLDGVPVEGRFVDASMEVVTRSVSRVPDRIAGDHFAVGLDDDVVVRPPDDVPWRVMIIGESQTGRSNALRAIAEEWKRRHSRPGCTPTDRRLVIVDHDEILDPGLVDRVDVDIVVAVDPIDLRRDHEHPAHVIRRHRTGLLLGRSMIDHADLLGVTPPPRPYASRPGRGEWVRRGIAMGVVQVTI